MMPCRTLRFLIALPFWLAAALTPYGARQLSAQVVEAEIGDVQIGIANCYKVGHWTPVRVEIAGGERLDDRRVEVIVEDSDGVPTRAAAPVGSPGTVSASRSAVVYTKVGRVGAPIRIRLLEGQTLVDERLIENPLNQAVTETVALPATGEMVVALSSAAFGLSDALPDRGDVDNPLRRRTVQFTDIAELPTDWFGYDAVDVLVIAAGDGMLVSELAADEVRYSALVRWVELGGKLVILCGGDSAEKLISPDGPLVVLVPGRLTEIVRLTETGPLEHFAGPSGPIPMTNRNAALKIPRLENVDGRIAAYAGRRPEDLPIVVRSAGGSDSGIVGLA